jgi:NTP pyrophosphatase (non-canonical NTP hydrolase)
MRETQKSISTWGIKTFGMPTNPKKIVERFVEEVIELDTKSSKPSHVEEIIDECADCLVVLYQVATAYGFDLHEAVNIKMKINRVRKWKTSGEGVGQHID